jgi:hypothetical protein
MEKNALVFSVTFFKKLLLVVVVVVVVNEKRMSARCPARASLFATAGENASSRRRRGDHNERRLRPCQQHHHHFVSRTRAAANDNGNNNNEDSLQNDPEETKKPSFGGGTDSNGRMHVPTDAFGGMSPEFKAASALKTLFTMVAVRVVMAQEEGYDNEGGGGTPTSIALGKFLEENPLRDGNEWLQKMLECEQTEMRLIALRLIEVRRAYAESQFDFNEVRKTAREEIEKDNDKLMIDYMKQSLSAE